MEGELNVTRWDTRGVDTELQRGLAMLRVGGWGQQGSEVVFGRTDAVLSDHDVWTHEVLYVSFFLGRVVLLEVESLYLIHTVYLSDLSAHHNTYSLLSHQLIDYLRDLFPECLLDFTLLRVYHHYLNVFIVNRVKIASY